MPDAPEYLKLADACIEAHKLAMAYEDPKIIAASKLLLFAVGQMIAAEGTPLEQSALIKRDQAR